MLISPVIERKRQMARHLLFVHTSPVEGQEIEYNAWYDTVHLPEVLELPDFVAAQRFEVTRTPGDSPVPQRYIALYEIETDDLSAAMQRLRQAAAHGMTISKALDRSSVMSYVMTSRGAR